MADPSFARALLIAYTTLIACSTTAPPAQSTVQEPKLPRTISPAQEPTPTIAPTAPVLAPGLKASPSDEKFTALGDAAFVGDLARVRALLKTGVDLNERGLGDATALMLALDAPVGEPGGCCCGDSADDCKPGPASNERSRRNRDARKAEIARALIARGADVTATDELGYSALHHAVMSELVDENVVDIMESMIAHGARVDLADPQHGRTPLELALDRGASRVECLLRHGADARRTTHEGESLVEVARQRGDAPVAKLLMDAIRKGGSDGS